MATLIPSSFRLSTMYLGWLLLGSLLWMDLVHTTSLSFLMNTKEQCFYALAPAVNKKIGFYFAVQSGGQFEINFVVRDPKFNIVIDGFQQRQGDYVFAAQSIGEYSFCFINDHALTTTKQVNLDLTVEDEHLTRPNFPSASSSSPSSASSPTPTSDTTELNNSIYRLTQLLTTYARNQKYYRTRENRNFDTVMTTQTRIGWFAVTESILIVIMSLGQVYFVRAFFSVTKKGRF